MTLTEQETIITAVRGDKDVSIYSSNPAVIRKLHKDDRVTIVKVHREDGEEVAVSALVSSKAFNPLTGFKRRSNMSAERRAELSERMKRLREA